MTPQFRGFTASETFTQVPDALFRLMTEITDLSELKVTLYVLWRIEHMDGAQRYVPQSEIAADESFMSQMTAEELELGLENAVQRGTLLRVESSAGGLFVLNSPRGRATAKALSQAGGGESARFPTTAFGERPMIFKLYEENIGPLTPLIAEALRDAEGEYSPKLIAEAFAEAVKMNKRNWKYIEAILKSWKEEGRAEKQNRRDTEEAHGNDVHRKVEEFLKRTR